ncbi:MAG: hypothetical protein H6575_17285 [Lewinellaceae bacterium]|nr:hypothetical protein [Saprospiraceae bacterium]MCB9356321.1 hypothetical protein [Lewinellaceae bacterium]
MKKYFLSSLFCLLFLSAGPLSAMPRTDHDPEVKVVVSPKKIWLLTDEFSVKNLTVQVLDARGKVVMEKRFSSKMTDWSLRIDALPEGRYEVMLDDKKATEFER